MDVKASSAVLEVALVHLLALGSQEPTARFFIVPIAVPVTVEEREELTSAVHFGCSTSFPRCQATDHEAPLLVTHHPSLLHLSTSIFPPTSSRHLRLARGSRCIRRRARALRGPQRPSSRSPRCATCRCPWRSSGSPRRPRRRSRGSEPSARGTTPVLATQNTFKNHQKKNIKNPGDFKSFPFNVMGCHAKCVSLWHQASGHHMIVKAPKGLHHPGHIRGGHGTFLIKRLGHLKEAISRRGTQRACCRRARNASQRAFQSLWPSPRAVHRLQVPFLALHLEAIHILT